MILIFLGAPGAGKGTQAELLSNKLNLPHLSTGDILRKKLLESDYLSLKLKKIMDSGDLVSDQILNEIMSIRLNNLDCKKGFILDGYPRTLMQNKFFHEYLEKNKKSISHIFDLKINEATIIERIKSRFKTENREDDKTEIINNRISKYFQETKPLSDHFSFNNSDKYHLINGNQDIEMIHQDILKISRN